MSIHGRGEANHQLMMDFAYHCPSCGFEGDAWAVGKGSAVTVDPYNTTGTAAQDAQRHATALAQTEARDIVRAAPCPKCKARPQLARIILLRVAAILAIWATAAVVGGFFSIRANFLPFVPLAILIGAGLSFSQIASLLRVAQGQALFAPKDAA